MFDWLGKIFRPSEANQRRRFFQAIDAKNAEANGGVPTVVTRVLGTLPLRSGTLVLGDPQEIRGLEIPNIVAGEVVISASLWQYPTGAERVISLTLQGGETMGGIRRQIGEIGIDSAKIVVADKADIEEHWTAVGPDRMGMITTAPDDTVLHLLTKRFNLKTIRVNGVSAKVVDPVSESLEAEIEEYLKSQPKYAAYPFMHFMVQTNNSFERAHELDKPWDFIPVGNSPEPRMFVCGTGRGDGCYEVQGEFDGEVPRLLTIDFLTD